MTPKSVFITGTKSGIGLELVRQFATCENPPKLIFASCRNPNDAADLRALADAHKNVHLVDLDVANDRQIEQAVKLVSSVVGDDGLNLLINNAGVLISEGSKFPNINREIINRQFDVNATSPLLMTQAFLPLLKKAAEKQPSAPMSISKAAVINVSSEGGSLHSKIPSSANAGGSHGYRASKGGLNVLTKNLSFDLKEYGILIVGMCPGFVDTGMTQKLVGFLQSQSLPPPTMNKMIPEQSVTPMMETFKRFTDAHNGGYFRRNGEKIEDYGFASATVEGTQ